MACRGMTSGKEDAQMALQLLLQNMGEKTEHEGQKTGDGARVKKSEVRAVEEVMEDSCKRRFEVEMKGVADVGKGS